jgi:hypothetical protein
MIKLNTFFSVNYISNVGETIEFWKSLGVKIIEHTQDKVVIDLGNFQIHYILETTEPFAEYQFATDTNGRGRGVLYYFEAEDLGGFYDKVKSLSPKHLTPLKNNHWDGREFLFSDPDGYLFVAYTL